MRIRNILLGILFFTQLIQAQKPTSLYEKAFSFLDVPNGPGGVVAIGKRDSIIFQKEYGLANIQTKERISQKTMFDIGSIAKQFTSFGIMLLEQEGIVGWEDDIRKYIPELPFNGDTIRLRHCAQHTSGLKDWVELSHIAGYEEDSSITFDESLSLIINQSTRNFSPGTKFEYSNSGYTLLAEVINRVTCEGYVDYIKEQVFKPSGLKTATFRSELKAVDNEATPYNFPTKTSKSRGNFTQGYGASSILMNINDAIRWVQFLIDPPEKYELIISKMKSKTRLVDGNPVNYGYGLYSYSYNTLNAIDHDGSWYGFSSLFFHFPNDGTFFIVMNNANYSDHVWEAVDVINDSLYGFEHKSRFEFNLKDYDLEEITPLKLKMFEGDFVILNRGHVKTFVSNNQLYAISPWFQEYPLYYLGNNKFICELGEISFKIKDDKVKKILIPFKLLKIKAVPYDPTKIKGFKKKDLIGEYYNQELNVSYKIKPQNNKLVLYSETHGELPLKQRKKAVFQVGKWWLKEINIIKENGIVVGFKIPLTVREYGEVVFEKK